MQHAPWCGLRIEASLNTATLSCHRTVSTAEAHADLADALTLNLHLREREDHTAGRRLPKGGRRTEGREDQHVLQRGQDGLRVLGSRENAVILNAAIGPN